MCKKTEVVQVQTLQTTETEATSLMQRRVPSCQIGVGDGLGENNCYFS